MLQNGSDRRLYDDVMGLPGCVVCNALEPTPLLNIMPDDRLLKEVVFGIMEGARRRGRHRIRWTDDV